MAVIRSYGDSIMELGTHITNNSRGKKIPFETDADKIFCLGKISLENFALDEFQHRNIIFIGDADRILERIHESTDILYINPTLQPFGFNLLHKVPKTKHSTYVSTLIDAMRGLSGYTIATPTMDKNIRNALLTLLHVGGECFLSASYLLTQPAYRERILERVKDKFLIQKWERFEAMSDKEQRDKTDSTENKFDAFVLDPHVRNCLGQKKNKMSLTKTVLITLNEDIMGDNAKLFGALTIAYLIIKKPANTTVFIPRAWRYGGIFAQLLDTPLRVVFSGERLDQFQKSVRSAILGVDQIVAARSSVQDAKILEPEFHLDEEQTPLSQLPDDEAYVRDGFHAIKLFLDPPLYSRIGDEKRIIKRCMSQCTQPLEAIEERLGRFFS